jgi:N-acetylglucosaminyldiphosphoundecaprenol N-acetyl-beta-D-mannosaminyltransferase
MNCGQRRFFGIDLVEDEGTELSPVWGDAPEKPKTLVLAGRRIVWRLVRNRTYREFFKIPSHRVAPVCPGLARQITLATGCSVGPYPEFQTLVRLLARAEETGGSIYLLGRNATELQRIEQNVRDTFPGLRIVGRAVFHPASIASVTTAIRKSAPRIVLSGVVSDSFFRWMVASADRIGPTLSIVSPRGLGRMAGRGNGVPISSVLFAPLRVFLPVILIAHRIRVIRRAKKARA